MHPKLSNLRKTSAQILMTPTVDMAGLQSITYLSWVTNMKDIYVHHSQPQTYQPTRGKSVIRKPQRGKIKNSKFLVILGTFYCAYRVSRKIVYACSLILNCVSHASLIIKWSIYFFLWIKIDAKNGITLKN